MTLSAGCFYNEKQFHPDRMVSVAQLVERRTVAPVVEGSSPSTHPNFIEVWRFAGAYVLASASSGAS